MIIDVLEKNVCKIIEAYKGFNLFKEGSKRDILFFVGLILLYVITSVAVFISNVFEKKLYILDSFIN